MGTIAENKYSFLGCPRRRTQETLWDFDHNFFGDSLTMSCGYTEISHNLCAKITSLAVHWFNWLFEHNGKGMWFECEQPFLSGEHCVLSRKTAAKKTTKWYKITKKWNISEYFFCTELKLCTVVALTTKFMMFPLWNFHGKTVGSRPSPFKR